LYCRTKHTRQTNVFLEVTGLREATGKHALSHVDFSKIYVLANFLFGTPKQHIAATVAESIEISQRRRKWYASLAILENKVFRCRDSRQHGISHKLFFDAPSKTSLE
jgi:hypothetical protein